MSDFIELFNSGTTFSHVVPDLFKQLEAEPNPIKHHYIKKEIVLGIKQRIAKALAVDVDQVNLKVEWQGNKCVLRKAD